MASLMPGRQSPFRRQPSTSSPNPLRASTPSSSPTKSSLLSPTRTSAASQDSASVGRPVSPFTASRETFARGGPASPEKESRPVHTNGTLNHAVAPESRNSPASRVQSRILAAQSLTPTSPFDGRDVFSSPSTQILAATDSFTPSRQPTAPLRQPVFSERERPSKAPTLPRNNGVYNNIPAPLLRSLRESFEVLDPNATGSLSAKALPPVLDQLGLPVDAKTMSSFFPPNQSPSLNLAAYLDMLCGPISQISAPDELAAAFGAFDADDSGQIDMHELKQALLRTVPEPGETNPGARLAEADIDSILQDFTGRRAFGARGAVKGSAAPRGDVFKWRDFVNSVNGGAAEGRTEAMAV